MTLPAFLLPHTVSVQTAGETTDDYGNTVPDWSAPAEVSVKARVEMIVSRGTEGVRENVNGRSDAVAVWRIFTNDAFTMLNRIEWSGTTFDVDGPVAPVCGSSSTVHHYEAILRAR